MFSKEEIFVNESYWKSMNENELAFFASKIFVYYNTNGFPYYPTDMEYRKKEFDKLIKYDRSNLFENNIIKQTMHGLGLAWSYFPHSFDVKCNNKMTPYEAYKNKMVFLDVIKKRLKMGTYISDSGIRKMLKIYSGVQGVSNFRPTAAAAIYEAFAKNGVVWDMSGGWGGRLLGAIVGGVGYYIATEPSSKTCEGLVQLAKDFAGDMDYNIICGGSEDIKPLKNSLDMCFTSPPYFDLEKYSDEPTQSYKKFNTKEAWVEGFLRPTFNNCHYGLKSDGVMLINIADPKGKQNINLESETVRVAEECGFRLVKTLKLALSNVNLRRKDVKFKYEPIFLFIKK
jgi:hypothetical protein